MIAVLGIVLYGLWIAARELTEYENLFVYVIFGILLLIVGTAVYLAYATPTFATKNVERGAVHQDTSNLLLEN